MVCFVFDNIVADFIIMRKFSSFNIFSFNKHLVGLNATFSSNPNQKQT